MMVARAWVGVATNAGTGSGYITVVGNVDELGVDSERKTPVWGNRIR